MSTDEFGTKSKKQDSLAVIIEDFNDAIEKGVEKKSKLGKFLNMNFG